jgi:hypothetical protein
VVTLFGGLMGEYQMACGSVAGLSKGTRDVYVVLEVVLERVQLVA